MGREGVVGVRERERARQWEGVSGRERGRETECDNVRKVVVRRRKFSLFGFPGQTRSLSVFTLTL